jgi:hypothetical protein
MFDRIEVRPGAGTKHVYSKADYREFKAPTDDSIRLLGEMEEKARKRIVEAIEVDNNVVTGMMYVLEPDYLGQSYKFLAKVKINYKEYVIEESISFYDVGVKGIEEMLRLLYKNVAEKIANDLMQAVVHTNGFKQMVATKQKQEELKSGNYSDVQL